ncbi:GntR family transcriptional regulator [Streptomyces sp. NPDC048415]|jgi:DNA-binding GntR family transcriptional regulator|uniref:GntR family transcriptional regulator n=1 Tax=Streptomyces sp. NPDC048415 TaxID=3154822 RepID=UPI003432E16B
MTDSQQRQLTKSGASVDRIVGTLLGRISTGSLGPGEQLRQEDLAKELGVSRVPVREALQVLLEQRVLVHQKHRGFFVAKRSHRELRQYHRMLELIEDEVIASIAWPTADTLAHLRSLNDRMLLVADDYDPAETLTLNREFHFQIFSLSPHSIMVDELARLWRLAQPFMATRMIASESRRQRVEEHRDIIDRIAAHDRPGLVTAMHRHRESPRLTDSTPETLADGLNPVGAPTS